MQMTVTHDDDGLLHSHCQAKFKEDISIDLCENRFRIHFSFLALRA